MWQKPDSLVCNFHGGNEIDTCHSPGLWGTYLQIPGRVFLPVAARIPESTVPVRIERTVGPGHSIKSTWPGLTPFFPAGLVPSKSVADSQTSSWYGLPMIGGTEKKGESASGKCGLIKNLSQNPTSWDPLESQLENTEESRWPLHPVPQTAGISVMSSSPGDTLNVPLSSL